jgi:hypothetical protein
MIQGGELAENCAYDGLAADSNFNRFDSGVCGQGDASIKEEKGNDDVENGIVRDQIHEQVNTIQNGPRPK